MMVYNHEQYIANAIEGVICQETSFKYRLIIGEDCSKDKSREIIARYVAAHPDKILPVYHDKNVGSRTNSALLLGMCTANYVALCEGDDYWIDKHKLQKQVDFLEANPDFTMCFTDVQIVDEMGWNKPKEEYYPVIENDVLTIDDFILSYKSVIPTPTILFRNILPRPLPDFFMKTVSGDICVHLLIADKGKTKYLPDVTAVYRNHAGGITKTDDVIARAYDMRIDTYEDANAYFGYRYNDQFRKQLLVMIKVRMIFGSKGLSFFPKLRNFRRNFGKYLKYSDKVNLKEIVYYVAVLFFPGLLRMVSKPKALPLQ